MRSRIEGFDFTLAEAYEGWRQYLLEDMPDLKLEINRILTSGDLVAYFATNSGTSKIYDQSAVWGECSILRLEGGKIVEWWGAEDILSQWRQFGFQIMEPSK